MIQTIQKKSTSLEVGDVLIINNKPLRIAGKWGLAISLDMYICDETRATSYTSNRKIVLKESQSFNVLSNELKNKSLFELNHILKEQ
jgi:hypothetical protein